MVRTSISGKVFDFFNITFLAVFSLLALYPFWNVFITSIVDPGEYSASLRDGTIILWPHTPNPVAYLFILGTSWIKTGLFNSVFITCAGTAYSMFLMTTISYAVTRKELPGLNRILLYFIVPAYFGGGLIPFYILVTRYLHWGDSFKALTITQGVTVFTFVILRTFFREIPDSLSESAKIDGANEVIILIKIILPLSLPAIATLTLFSAVGFWNDWFGALLFIASPNKEPLQKVLRDLVIDTSQSAAQREEMKKRIMLEYGINSGALSQESINSATIMVATVPILCVYPFLQKYFAKGVMIGSVKS